LERFQWRNDAPLSVVLLVTFIVTFGNLPRAPEPQLLFPNFRLDIAAASVTLGFQLSLRVIWIVRRLVGFACLLDFAEAVDCFEPTLGVT
jgi:hypothetical protein